MRTWKDVRSLEQRLSRILWKLEKQPGNTSQVEFIQAVIETLKWVDGRSRILDDFAKDQEAILDEKWRTNGRER